MIHKGDLVPRGIYRVYSRNLVVGVWDGTDDPCGFVGIRRKFNEEFLFTEYHWEDGPPYGTVKPTDLLGVVPDGTVIACYLNDWVGAHRQLEPNPELEAVLRPYDLAELERRVRERDERYYEDEGL